MLVQEYPQRDRIQDGEASKKDSFEQYAGQLRVICKLRFEEATVAIGTYLGS